MISLINLIFFVTFLVIVWQFFRRKSPKELNGPRPLPILGNILSFGKSPHLTIHNWVQTYGKIYQMFIGSKRHIVISDLELMKKAFNHPSFAGRTEAEVFDFGAGSHGVTQTEGTEWQEQRRFTLRHLRDFGFGKNSMEELILEEVDGVLIWAKSLAQRGESTTLELKFILAVVNSLWRIMTGQRFKHNDPKLLQFYQQFFLTSRGVNALVIIGAPKLAKLLPNASGWNKLREALRSNVEFIKPIVLQHQEKFSKAQQDPRDFIDAYLSEISKTTDPTSSFFGELGIESLIQLVMDLFQAGSFTTSTTLHWLALYMVLHLEVQAKLQREIDEVIGSSRRPSLTDKTRMVYTEAVILETMRKSSLTPMGIFHTATENTTFEGFEIPKGTAIVPNQYHIHHDPDVWGDPETFRPERFIDSDGKIIMKDRIVPFSTGKRVCPGESLARDELFLFTTSLVQNFELRYDPALPIPSMVPVTFVDILEPRPFHVVLKERYS